MEKHQVIFPTQSTPLAFFQSDFNVAYNYNVHHDEKKEILRNQRKDKSVQNESDKENQQQHRYVFHTRSPEDILDDGYQWRKYGQKIVKNNKFPRSYYRCSHRDCNVKKQIQRHSEDEEIVVTSYEGIHTHRVDKSAESFDQIFENLLRCNSNLLCHVPPTLNIPYEEVLIPINDTSNTRNTVYD